jgi:hypothetical protein
MRRAGKKIGTYGVQTVLAAYTLDVRLDMSSNDFSIRVPCTPGAVIEGVRETQDEDGTTRIASDYEIFSDKSLEALKGTVSNFLKTRDTTTFVDVIEYCYTGLKSGRHWGSASNHVGFDFRVARVSTARNVHGTPKLEIPVVVDSLGIVSVRVTFEKECGPESHSHRFDSAMTFTVERWQKCCAIRDGIRRIDTMLSTLFEQDGVDAERALDALPEKTRLLLGVSEDD